MAYQSYNAGGYQQSNYSAGGGQNAGGFVASQGTGSKSDYRKTSNTALRPVQIEQVLNASQPHPDSPFMIDGAEIGAITFVGRVVNVSSAATNTTYKIDDGTGSIEVKQWVDAERATKSQIKNDSNVRIHGSLKTFNQKRHIAVSSLKVVANEKELKYHQVHAQFVSLYYTKGPLNGQKASEHGDDGVSSSAHASELQQKLNSLDPFSRKVMEAIHASPESNEGVNVRALQKMVGGGNLLATIESLKEDGHLYTTIDEDHVKSTM